MILSGRWRLPPRLALGRSGTEQAASLLLLIAALWLAIRPYYGIVGDARFYIIPAVRELYPAGFADDLYFRFGATDRFTIFPKLAAPFIAVFGLANGAMLLTIVGHLLWLGGLLYCASGFLRDRSLVLLSVVAVVALPSGYSHYGYAEPFVTPRLLAEAVTLLALGFLARGRVVASLGLLTVSMMIHPIMTLGGVGLALIYLALNRPIWWSAMAAGAGAALGLALAGVPPFANLLTRYDPAWFEVASTRNSDTLMSAWSAEDYCWIIPTIALAAMALAVGGPAERRLFGGTLLVGLGALVCTVIGADLAHNVLILQMMPWRSMWLPTVLAHLYVVPLLVWLHRQGGIEDLTKATFLTGLWSLLLARLIPPLVIVAAPVIVFAVSMVVWQYRTGRPLSAPARIVCVVAIGVTGAAIVLFAHQFVITLLPVPDDLWRRLWSFAVVLAAVALAATQLPNARGRRGERQRWLPVLTAALVPIALFGWDVRTPWTRLVEAQGPVLAAVLPEPGSVYWEGGAEMLWFGMLRSSYFSCAQGTGAIFFREAAIEFRRRVELFAQLHTRDFDEPDCRGFAVKSGLGRTREALERVCRREPGLDYVVLASEVPGAQGKIWMSPAPLRSVQGIDGKVVVDETDRFYLYSCAQMR